MRINLILFVLVLVLVLVLEIRILSRTKDEDNEEDDEDDDEGGNCRTRSTAQGIGYQDFGLRPLSWRPIFHHSNRTTLSWDPVVRP